MTAAPPLQGRRILVTRGADKRDELSALLEAAGATVVWVPLIAAHRLAAAAEIGAAVDRAVDANPLPSQPWLVLTSAIGADLVMSLAAVASVARLAVAVVGPATAEAVRFHGIEPDLVSHGQVGEALAADLVDRGVEGSRVLLVTAAGARDVIAPRLTAAGATVEVLEAYRSVPPHGAGQRLRAALQGPPFDAVAFTSASTVRHFAEAVAPPPPRCVALCIGPVTAAAARAAGWTGVITATQHTTAGLAAAAVAHLAAVQPLP